MVALSKQQIFILYVQYWCWRIMFLVMFGAIKEKFKQTFYFWFLFWFSVSVYSTLKIYVKEKKHLYFFKTLCIYAAYNFIRRNCNGPSMVLHVPHISLLEVGMSYLDWFRIFMPCFQFQSTWTSHGSFDISLLEVGTVCLVWIRFSL